MRSSNLFGRTISDAKNGPETLVKDDYVVLNKYNKEYGRVSQVIGKTVYYNTVHVDREWDKDLNKFKQNVPWTTPVHLHPYHAARVCQRRYETMLRLGKSVDSEIEEPYFLKNFCSKNVIHIILVMIQNVFLRLEMSKGWSQFQLGRRV